jgi:hypothetical protein
LGAASVDEAQVVAHYERRGSERFPVDVAIRWRKATKWRRRAQRATIVDVSMTGALIQAPADDAITIGSLMEITIGKVVGTVEIRRMEASAEPSAAYFGVRFVDGDGSLRNIALEHARRNRTHT